MSHAAAASNAPFDFAQFLLDRDAITAQQADEVRRRAQNERVPIGQLLMQSNFLSVKQVMAVLAIQADKPTEKFGQIALGQGFLTLRQLEDALRIQRLTRRHMIEVVSVMGLLESRQLLEVAVAYISLLEMTMSVG